MIVQARRLKTVERPLLPQMQGQIEVTERAAASRVDAEKRRLCPAGLERQQTGRYLRCASSSSTIAGPQVFFNPARHPGDGRHFDHFIQGKLDLQGITNLEDETHSQQ